MRACGGAGRLLTSPSPTQALRTTIQSLQARLQAGRQALQLTGPSAASCGLRTPALRLHAHWAAEKPLFLQKPCGPPPARSAPPMAQRIPRPDSIEEAARLALGARVLV